MLTTPRYLDEDEGAVNTHMLSKDPGIAREKMRKRKKSIYREPTKAAFHKLKQKGIVQCIDRPIEVPPQYKEAPLLLRCNECEVYFNTILKARKHIRKKHTENKIGRRSRFCFICYKSAKEVITQLNIHLINFHYLSNIPTFSLLFMEVAFVCSLCKQGDYQFFTSPVANGMPILADHPPLSLRQLKELDRVFVESKENKCLRHKDRLLRSHICDIIKQHIKLIYPDADVLLFGSSANGFGSLNSDIDVNIKLPGIFKRDDCDIALKNVVRHFKKAKGQWDWKLYPICSFTTARVSLMKLVLTRRWNNLECDVSLRNHLAVYNTQLLAHYARIDKRVQVMGYVLKEFAKNSNMCDASSGSLSSYAYIILLLHYLQQVKPPVIPVLQQIGEGGHVDVDGWNCWFHRFDDLSQLEKIWPNVGENKKTIGELLIDFFKYYMKEFDWRQNVVSIRTLELLSKAEKNWKSKRVCIEDPFRLDQNLSNHLNNKKWSYMCNAFKCFHDHITDPQLHIQPLTISTVLNVKIPRDMLCDTCGKPDHISFDCPKIRSCVQCGRLEHTDSKGRYREERTSSQFKPVNLSAPVTSIGMRIPSLHPTPDPSRNFVNPRATSAINRHTTLPPLSQIPAINRFASAYHHTAAYTRNSYAVDCPTVPSYTAQADSAGITWRDNGMSPYQQSSHNNKDAFPLIVLMVLIAVILLLPVLTHNDN